MTSHLDELEERHRDEERAEGQRSLIDTPRPLGIRLPPGGDLPRSQAWLERFYEGGRMVREKKPGVFDHLRSYGPYFVSVDDDPLSVIDGMSQTATVAGGFAHDAIVRAWLAGEFGTTPQWNDPRTIAPSAQAFADLLRTRLPGLPEISFTNSGAEANEKALALCRLRRPEAGKVLAFEGGFHGRTLLTLHATANPKKRVPYEIAGYEVTFAPFPVWTDAVDDGSPAPDGFLEAVGRGAVADLVERYPFDGDPNEGADGEALLGLEAHCLRRVHDVLAGGEYFVCLVEAMQSEGGDRYATARFFQALRLLTRHHGVALVFDEVQTGFGLGGPFAWHSRFGLVDAAGAPDVPDAVTFAKRAQVGVVMSRIPDPAPTATHGASLVRGRLHASMIDADHAAQVERLVGERLPTVARRFPELVSRPRGRGYAFAFDLPTPEHLGPYIAQRFWRGAVVFGAGSRTVRYRLSLEFGEAEIDRLFETIEATLGWMQSHPAQSPPSWEDTPSAPAPKKPALRVRDSGPAQAEAALENMMALEARIYEPARREPRERLLAQLTAPESVVQIAEVEEDDGWRFVGFSVAVPLEEMASVDGVKSDPHLGKRDTLYSVSVTVDPDRQGQGIGNALKRAQLEAARARLKPDGTERYAWVTGRNRIGHTAAMSRLNRRFGAVSVQRLEGQYGDEDGHAIYYRIPLRGLSRPASEPDEEAMDVSGGIRRPFRQDPLADADREGRLVGPVVDKITLCNYITPAIVRAVEWVTALRPDLPHLYLTSSRDECVDKSLRVLRHHRPQAQVAIGLEGGYLGHTTAAARSLSDPSAHTQGPAYFAWPRVPYPETEPDGTLAALELLVEAAGGADQVLGVYVEALQEWTGRVLSEVFWSALGAFRRTHGIPVVVVDSAGTCYRSGRGVFASSQTAFVPDLFAWWGGGQAGYLHVTAELFVATPLTMVSTWDGDELSMLRDQAQLRLARSIDMRAATTTFEAALAGLPTQGQGLYRVLDAGDAAPAVVAGLAEAGFHAHAMPGGRIPLAPPLDAPRGDLERLGAVLQGLA